MPAVLALHGHGAHAQDLIGLAPVLAAGRVLWLCPQAPYALEPGVNSYTWFERGPAGSRDPESFERTVAMLHAFIDDAFERYRVDRDRVVLLGFSQGGSLAYRIALVEPQRFRGLAALSTWLPEEMAESITPGAAVGALPVLVQHGSQDPMVSVDRARDSRDRLRGLGVEPEYHEYEMGHGIGAESTQDLSRWMERVLGLAPSSVDA